jgi:E3 Ubiquitin ligase
MFLVEIPIYATLALGAGPWLFARAFRNIHTRRLIQNTPTSHIRSMAMGLVELQGEVVTGSAHEGPFSGRPCAYWEVDIATRSSKQGWSIVHRASSGNPFYIRDTTGLALVYPTGAECKVKDQVEEECSGISLPECYAEYLDQRRLAFRYVWRMSTLRFRERILEDGQQVFVLGTAMPPARVVGVSDGAELAATGTDGADRRVRELQSEAAGIVRRGDRDRVFIISQESQRDLTFDLGLKAWGQLIAGPTLAASGLAYWLYYLSQHGRFSG